MVPSDDGARLSLFPVILLCVALLLAGWGGQMGIPLIETAHQREERRPSLQHLHADPPATCPPPATNCARARRHLGGDVHFEAFQVSKQAVKLFKEGWFQRQEQPSGVSKLRYVLAHVCDHPPCSFVP